MSSAVALGAAHELDGFALVGVRVIAAATGSEIEAAWRELGDEVALVILSPDAAERLAGAVAERTDLLTVVMP